MHIAKLSAWSLIAILGCASTALAQFDPKSSFLPKTTQAAPLPYYDQRLDANSLPIESVKQAVELARVPEQKTAKERDTAALKAAIRGLRVSEHDLFGTPYWVGSTESFLTGPRADVEFDAADVVKQFIGAHRGLFEIDADELDRANVSRNLLTKHNGVRHFSFTQQIEGVDIFDCEVKASVTQKGELINVSSTMLPRPEGDFQTPRESLSALDAIHAAAANMGVTMHSNPTALTAPQGSTRKQLWSNTPDFRDDIAITTEFTYFAVTRTEIHPAWSLVLPEIGIGNTYEYIVDATDGTVLRRRNQLCFFGGTEPITLNVYTSDSPAPGSPGNATSPTGFQFPFVPRTLVTVTAAEVAPYSPNHWIDDGVNETIGNNVDAHTDLDANNSPDLPRPTGSPYRTFNYGLDTTMAPSTYRDAAVTQLFYLCNRYHDRLYSMGYDEPAKNFQNDNFGMGGLGGDRVQADCQDGSGTNNANFGSSGADGTSGRMQMYVFTGPNPDRDGDLDADIVFHEHSHGLSTRLHNGTVSGTQSGGMGEGWGDFFGVCLNAESTDDPNANYCTGGYATYQFSGLTENYYFGIRRFPYSTDLNKNPQTYADIDPAQQSYPPAIPRSSVIGNTANEVHNVGEVWCNALLECRAGLWGAMGFAGNELMMQLVVDGMKLSPSNPNFLDARDAIIQADLVNNGGANSCILWERFAKRGMGKSATSPSGGSSSSGIVEAYDVPPLVLFTYPSGLPTQLQPGMPTVFQVKVEGLCAEQPISGTGLLHFAINGGGYTAIGMTETAPNEYDATLPAGGCLDQFAFYVSTDTTGVTETDPAGAPVAAHAASVYTSVNIALEDTFDSDMGWTATNLGASTGDWQRGVPVNDPSWAYGPVADGPDAGTQCFMTQNAAGNTDVDGGSVRLESPTFDMSGGGTISYDYYLNLTVTDGVDRLLVEISSNGAAGPWTVIATHTTDGGQSWRHNDVTQGALTGLGVTSTATMRVRFTANDSGTASIVEGGVDHFLVQELVCDAPGTAYCFGDGVDPVVTVPCPCANFGDLGRGCANSNSLLGGSRLDATGTTIPNTIVFTANGIPNGNLCTFLRGTTNTGAGTLFGDGVKCIDGTLIRFGQQVSGAGGNPSNTVSVAPATVATGNTRYYQLQYRNPAPGFCPPGTFNASNGYIISW